MTNKELIAYCKDEGIEVKAKNVSKPTKTELIDAIKLFKEQQSKEDEEFLNTAVEPTDEVEETQDINTPDVETKEPVLTRSQKRRIQRSELFPLRRVLISSNSNNQTQTNLIFVTWGNGLIGHQTDRVYLNKPWHVREGALRNLRDAKISQSIQDDSGNTVKFETKPAYNIQTLDPLSKDEIDKIGKRQVIRDSSIESLI